MNSFDRDVLDRASSLLNLQPPNEAIDYDIIGPSPGLQLLFGSQAVRVDQIDLLCTHETLIFKVQNEVVRIPWAAIVEFELKTVIEHQYLIYLSNCSRLSARLKGAPRDSFVSAVEDQLSTYSSSLSQSESATRRETTHKVLAWKAEMLERERRVKKNWKNNMSVHADLVLDDDTVFPGEVLLYPTTLMVRAIFPKKGMANIPYEALSEFFQEEEEAVTSLCNLTGIKQITVRCPDPPTWLDDYEMRRQGWWL